MHMIPKTQQARNSIKEITYICTPKSENIPLMLIHV